MSNRDLATGVFRARGLMWWIYVLVSVPQLLNMLLRRHSLANDATSASYFVSSEAISVGCQIVVAVFLTRRAGWLASLVFPNEQGAVLAFSAEELQAVLFSVVGLYLVLDGVRHALGSGYQLIVRPSGDTQNAAAYLWQRNPEDLIRALGGIAGGALVFFGRRGLRNLWERCRRGISPIEESAGSSDE
jgi:protein-S-isoprenylcysteine O-methyltransferase Ste14